MKNSVEFEGQDSAMVKNYMKKNEWLNEHYISEY